jgi:hypothetical protein
MPHTIDLANIPSDTEYNGKKLCRLYDMSESKYYEYLEAHQDKLYELASKRTRKNGKVIKKQKYNSKQLLYMITKVFQDLPEGYKFNGKTLVKCDD